MKNKSFVLHFRLTKSCNANCSYCSSAMNSKLDAMTSSEAILSARNILKYWDMFGIDVEHLTIEYVGGEVTMLPLSELKDIITGVRNVFIESGIKVNDGIQSNLIADKNKLIELYDLVDGRIGTSLDHISSERKIGDSSRRYMVVVKKSLERINSIKGKTIPAVITIDKNNIDLISYELKKANEDGRSLTFRPVFQGGSEINPVTDIELLRCLTSLYSEWVLKSNVIVEPFYSLLRKRLFSNNDNYCSWQSNCIENSLSIEPNGDLYLCQEMADFNHAKIGNILTNEIDKKVFRMFFRRAMFIQTECSGCPYFNDCQGGCMVHSVERGLPISTKSPYCIVWKGLFKIIDESIDKNSNINNWLESLR